MHLLTILKVFHDLRLTRKPSGTSQIRGITGKKISNTRSKDSSERNSAVFQAIPNDQIENDQIKLMRDLNSPGFQSKNTAKLRESKQKNFQLLTAPLRKFLRFPDYGDVVSGHER